MRICLLLAALVASCAPGAPSSPSSGPLPDLMSGETAGGNVDGSRLKVRMHSLAVMGADGSRMVLASSPYLYDTDMETACADGPAADCSSRCMPTAMNLPYFADDRCTQLLGSVQKGKTTPPFLAVIGAAACSGNAERVFRPGAMYTGDVYWQAGGGACQKYPGIASQDWYRLGDELAADRFVQMTESQTP